MTKKLDEATKLLIDSLPESLKELALSASEIGYLSQMDFDNAIQADEVPDEEKDEVSEFFKQDLGLEFLETDSNSFARDMEKYYEEDDDNYNRDKTRDLLNTDAEQVDVNDDDYEHYAKQLERSSSGNLVLGIQDSVQSYLKQIGTVQLLTAAGEIAIAGLVSAIVKWRYSLAPYYKFGSYVFQRIRTKIIGSISRYFKNQGRRQS